MLSPLPLAARAPGMRVVSPLRKIAQRAPALRQSPGLVKLERVTGIEPVRSAWEADRLPLHHTRLERGHCHSSSLAGNLNMGGFETSAKLLGAGIREFPIIGSHDEIRSEISLAVERIAPDRHAGMLVLHLL